MVDTSAEAAEALIAQIRDHLEWVERERARLSSIKATIRLNATRHGATPEQTNAFISGEASFIDWLSDVVSGPQSTLAAERDTLRAQLDAAEDETLAAVKRALEAAAKVAQEGPPLDHFSKNWEAIRALDPAQFVKGQDTC